MKRTTNAGSVKRSLALFLTSVLSVVLVMAAAPSPVSAAPTHKAPALSSAEVVALVEFEVTTALEQEQEQAGQEQRGVPAALVGIITLCVASALASVGQSVVENLIMQGRVGEARQLLASAASGCVFGAVGGAAGAACRVFPPCRKAVTTAIEKAVRKIIDELS